MKRKISEEKLRLLKIKQQEIDIIKPNHELAKKGEVIRLDKVKTGMILQDIKTKEYYLITNIKRYGGIIVAISGRDFEFSYDMIERNIECFDKNSQIELYRPVKESEYKNTTLNIYRYIDAILKDRDRHKEIKPIIASVIEDKNNKKLLNYIKDKLWNMPRKSMKTPRHYEIKCDMCHYDKKKVKEVEIVYEGRFRAKSFHNEFLDRFKVTF